MTEKKCCRPTFKVGKKPQVVFTQQSTMYEITGEFSSPSDLFTVDPNSGNFNFVGATGTTNMLALGVNPLTRIMFGIVTVFAGAVLYTISKETGASTILGPITGFNNRTEIIVDMTFSPQGAAYVVTIGMGTITLYLLNVTTRKLTSIATYVTSGIPLEAAITFDSSGRLFITQSIDNSGVITNLLLQVDPTTGVPISSAVIDIGNSSIITGFVFNPETGHFYINTINLDGGTDSLFSFDITGSTIVPTFISNEPDTISALAVDTISVANIVGESPGVKFKTGPCC